MSEKRWTMHELRSMPLNQWRMLSMAFDALGEYAWAWGPLGLGLPRDAQYAEIFREASTGDIVVRWRP